MNNFSDTASVTWHCTKFSDLSAIDLYRILQLRNEVFVVEQNCVYQDCDDKDQPAFHLCGYAGDQLVAYARLLPPTVSYADAASIGRVLTAASVRKHTVGKKLMQEAISAVYHHFGTVTIVISAQLYLKRFYEQFGFVSQGDIYQEDAIDHIQMQKNPPVKSQ